MTVPIDLTRRPSRDRETLTVDDVMSAPVATVGASEDLWAAIDRFNVCGLRHLVVVDDSGAFAGVLGDRLATDAVRHDRRELELTRVRDLALDRRTCVPSGTGLVDAAARMLHHSAGALAVVDEHTRVLGIVTGADLLRAMVAAAVPNRPRSGR